MKRWSNRDFWGSNGWRCQSLTTQLGLAEGLVSITCDCRKCGREVIRVVKQTIGFEWRDADCVCQRCAEKERKESTCWETGRTAQRYLRKLLHNPEALNLRREAFIAAKTSPTSCVRFSRTLLPVQSVRLRRKRLVVLVKVSSITSIHEPKGRNGQRSKPRTGSAGLLEVTQ